MSAFIPRGDGFSLQEIGRHLHISVDKVMALADACGIRQRYVTAGKKCRRAPLTLEETRALLLYTHSKKGARLTR